MPWPRVLGLVLALAFCAALVYQNLSQDSDGHHARDEKPNPRSSALRSLNGSDVDVQETCLVWDPFPSECYDMASPVFLLSNETNSSFFGELQEHNLLWDQYVGDDVILEELEWQNYLDPWYRHEYRALMLYTAQAKVKGVKVSTLLNKELQNRETVTMPHFAQVLASGVNRVDPYYPASSEDPLYRGVILPPNDDTIEKQWLSGASIVQEPTFFSASRSYTQALCVLETGLSTKDVVLYQFIIQYAHPNATENQTETSFLGTGAADLEPFTFSKGQYETLFAPGTLFRVAKFERKTLKELPMVEIFIIPLNSDNWVEDMRGHWSPINDNAVHIRETTTLRDETENTYRETMSFFGHMLDGSECYFYGASTDGEDNKYVIIGAVSGVAALLAVALGFFIWYKFVRRPSDVTVTAVSINRPQPTVMDLASGTANDKPSGPMPPPPVATPLPDQLPADLPGLDYGSEASESDASIVIDMPEISQPGSLSPSPKAL